MYTATMLYTFKTSNFPEACAIWQRVVFERAQKQAGFVRMQFLTNCPEAMAIGTWQDKSFAEAFMQTGVFRELMAQLESHCSALPMPKVWHLECFAGD